MIYADDLELGVAVDCGSAFFPRDEIIHFASQYDPQLFHLNDEDAAHSLFGRLTASGMHAATVGWARVLNAVMKQVCYLGSPGVRRVQMHKPVYVDALLHVRHSFVDITPLERWPGVVVAGGLTEAFAPDGTLVMTLEDLSWIGSRQIAGPEPKEFAALTDTLMQSQEASAALGPLELHAEIPSQPTAAPADGRAYFDDCPIGATFTSEWLDLDPAELVRFHAQYDGDTNAVPTGPQEGAAANRLVNHWFNPGKLHCGFAKSFWQRSTNVGGPGMRLIRWPRALQKGDRIRGKMTVVDARPLRSRPGHGVLDIRCVSVNQRSEVVAIYHCMPFFRMRS